MSEPAAHGTDHTVSRPGHRSPLVRSLLAGVIGAVLVLAWWLVFQAIGGLPFFVDGDDFRCEGLGCAAAPLGALFVNLMLTTALVFGGSVAASWPLLRLARVDPVWPVVLLGPVGTLFMAWLADRTLANATASAAGMAALGYALAAYLTAPSLRRNTRVLLLVAVLGIAIVRAATSAV
ncbi:hypothetical protein [Amycolatopsis cihanbeyliensis]|uniref:Uncharacterized protein n=1 Tax=Amycolatopsis cihanbeyliensis TaxID=1128664 RepID=A0A542DQU5_AMYCI|nr:hypothetical protein [Amycolatopsis cihanbeyliensis]TQJ05325.1 hypothetical protein FB471_5153 [Amycolatopsis cihanbeyliensis]